MHSIGDRWSNDEDVVPLICVDAFGGVDPVFEPEFSCLCERAVVPGPEYFVSEGEAVPLGVEVELGHDRQVLESESARVAGIFDPVCGRLSRYSFWWLGCGWYDGSGHESGRECGKIKGSVLSCWRKYTKDVGLD